MNRTASGRLALLLGLVGCAVGVVSAYTSLPQFFDLSFRAGFGGRAWSFFSLLIVNPFFLMGVLAILVGVALLHERSSNSPDQ